MKLDKEGKKYTPRGAACQNLFRPNQKLEISSSHQPEYRHITECIEIHIFTKWSV